MLTNNPVEKESVLSNGQQASSTLADRSEIVRRVGQGGFNLADRDEVVRRAGQGGFTLIELLIVIVILAILAAIVVFAVGSTTKNAVAASCSSDAKSIETGLAAFNAQVGSYPTSVGVLTSTTAGVGTGPWLRSLPSTTHYSIFSDAAGHIYVVNPATPTASLVDNATVTAGTLTGVVSAGGTFDFDADPAVCKQFS